jgi:hypothetical protein
MPIDRQRMRRALNLAIRHTLGELGILQVRACDPTVARDNRPDAVLWRGYRSRAVGPVPLPWCCHWNYPLI